MMREMNTYMLSGCTIKMPRW